MSSSTTANHHNHSGRHHHPQHHNSEVAAALGVGFHHFRCNSCWDLSFSDQDATADAEMITFKIRGCHHNICERCVDYYHAEQERRRAAVPSSSSLSSSAAAVAGSGVVASATAAAGDVSACPVCLREIDPRRDVLEITQRDLHSAGHVSTELLKAVYLNPHSECVSGFVRACLRDRICTVASHFAFRWCCSIRCVRAGGGDAGRVSLPAT
jgi:hypothetical protein